MKKRFNHIFSVFALAVLVLSAISCSKDDDQIEEVIDPVADFTSEVAEDNPQLVSFINNSENAEEYFWDFGDGSEVSTQKHPTHRYESAGNYTVILTALNGEASNEVSREIAVVGVPTAGFSFEADQDNSYTIHFENQSQNVTQYAWDFGDGTGTSSEEDPSYTYSEKGTYTVTLTATGAGGTAETFMQVEVKDAQPEFGELYIVGDASASGWNIGSPEAFTQSETNPFIFTYEGLLTPGNLKFSTYTGDWCDAAWINAPEASMSINSTTGYIVTQGCEGPDNQWVVTEETQGLYTITVNMEEETVSFEELAPAYSELYIVGDATPSGWNIASPEAFTQTENPFVFTYEAYLSPGNLKISTYTGDWCDDEWLHASEAGQSITAATAYEVFQGCEGPDNQWTVTEETEGNYLVRVNLYDQTIAFEAL